MALILESDLHSYIDDTSVNPTNSATRSYSFLGTGYDFTVLLVLDDGSWPRTAGSLKLCEAR